MYTAGHSLPVGSNRDCGRGAECSIIAFKGYINEHDPPMKEKSNYNSADIVMSQLSRPDTKDSKGLRCTQEQELPPPSYTATTHALSSIQDTKAISTSSLETLPSHVLSEITKLLDPVSRRCLCFTNRRFRSMGYGDEDNLTRCGKWRIMAHLEQDFVDAFAMKTASQRPRNTFSSPFLRSSSTLPKGLTRLTCALCKTKHGTQSFLKGAPRTAAIHARNEKELLAQKSVQRICTWHFGKVVCIVNYKPSTPGMAFGRWVSTIKEMCTHCGQIEQYGKCNCGVPTSLNEKSIPPACEICPKVKMRVYERMKKEGDRTEISWNFKMDKDGTVYVIEDRVEPGKTGKTPVHIPVEYR